MTNLTDSVLKVSGLTKRYNDDAGQSVIIENLDLEVKRNEFLCILGPSGCGKTTLLRCIAGFEQYEGTVSVNGKVKTGPGSDAMMVFQEFDQLFPWRTVAGNIAYPLKLQGVADRSEREKRAREALDLVRLSGYGKYYPHQLSGGMKQRVAIAKALALRPQIILMDEPLATLDAMTRREFQEEMLRISSESDSTIIFVTHNIQEALILGTRSIVLQKKGRIVLDEKNEIEKPVSPASPGFGAAWQRMMDAIYMKEEE